MKAAAKACGVCGKTMEPWAGKDDVVDVVHRIPAQWIIKRCTLEKCRCPEGCSIVTADGPTKLISGGRYTLDVALMSCIDKFRFHIPIERQAQQAKLVGMRITSQALWDQQWALAKLLEPLVDKIKAHVLSRDWLGADLTPFMHIKKGGSTKQQVWQLACPDARYFEMLASKSSKTGEQVFAILDAAEKVVSAFKGIAVVDGAAELEKLARDLGFNIANCWSHARETFFRRTAKRPVKSRSSSTSSQSFTRSSAASPASRTTLRSVAIARNSISRSCALRAIPSRASSSPSCTSGCSSRPASPVAGSRAVSRTSPAAGRT